MKIFLFSLFLTVLFEIIYLIYLCIDLHIFMREYKKEIKFFSFFLNRFKDNEELSKFMNFVLSHIGDEVKE